MAGKSTDVRIRDISFDYEDFHYRAPLKFGGVAIDRVTLLNVHSVVEGASGQTARGFGSMPLGNVWSFPSKVLGYDDTLRAMKSLTERFAKITAECKDKAHPIDLAAANDRRAAYRQPGLRSHATGLARCRLPRLELDL